MFKRLSSAFKTTGFVDLSAASSNQQRQSAKSSSDQLRPRFAYCRPDLLGLELDGDDERSLASDTVSRPVLVAGDRTALPGFAGYAEAINGGKTQLLRASPDCLLATYFAMFDGHAGDGAATYAKQLLQLHLREKLMQVYPLLLERINKPSSETPAAAPAQNGGDSAFIHQPDSLTVSFDQLVIGALESAFIGLDDQICRERTTYRITGGCTALVLLFLADRLYVANAGDTRAVLCQRTGSAQPLSVDLTPYNDRERLQLIASHHPELLHKEFCALQFARRLGRRDLGERVLCRHGCMQGWHYKTVTEEDLLFPLISRLLATIGVARGFGDHDLRVFDSPIQLKPFLSCVPQVTVVQTAEQDGCEDVLVMATDGLWDVISCEAVAKTVQSCLNQAREAATAANSLTIVAQELVGAARGAWQKPERPGGGGGGSWRLPDGEQASVDDISCFVIPLDLHSRLSRAERQEDGQY
uniref:PPM-type phosphatase domain-containing protein n=1 Tax=Macrostomum lignano TaxID=282301 RepID=A0A1I8GQ59_9PLAT